MRHSIRYLGLLPALLGSTSLVAGEAEDDFAYRCSQSGVVLCVGFDDQTEANEQGLTQYAAQVGSTSVAGKNGNPVAAAYPDNIDPNKGLRYPAVDYTVSASGAGALRLTANQVSASAQAGQWLVGTSGDSPWAKDFGAGETMYMQYRARYDEAFTTTQWETVGGGGTKQFILWRDGSSCTDLQLVMVDSNDRGFPQMYTACGANGFAYEPGTYSAIPGHVQWLFQHGPDQAGAPIENDYACMRNFETDDTCGYFRGHANQWWTYQLEVTIGEPGTETSRVRAWVSRGPNEAMRQFVDWGPFAWNYEAGKTFENLALTLYKTDKSSSEHPLAHMWYDELIISSEPIPLPYSDTTVPNPPENLIAE
jgi:hypothetical protein